jgi:hypothetical protein
MSTRSVRCPKTNGDENDQGPGWRIGSRQLSIEKVKL